jgi:hypothetical protein
MDADRDPQFELPSRWIAGSVDMTAHGRANGP